MAGLSHSSGLPAILSTVLAISNSNCGTQAKATCSGSTALMCFDPGASDRRSPYGRRHRPDAAHIRLEAPVGGSRNQRTRLHDWCYLELADLEAEEFNSAKSRSVDAWPTDPSSHRRWRSRFFTTGVQLQHLSKPGRRRRPSVAIEDSFETAKNEFGSITTRADLGMAGIVTFPWPCVASP